MKSPHIIVSVLSLFLMIGLARAIPEMDGGQRAELSQPPLAAKLQALLPAGTNLVDAFEGFSDLGEFISAVHVSNNLDIPFAQLKQRLTGWRPMSLDRAIAQLRPKANATDEVRRAQAQARRDRQR